MNSAQVQEALGIMSKLEARPIWKLIENLSTSSSETVSRPISFSTIQEKLKNGLYESEQSWEDEVRVAFSNFQKEYETDEVKRVSITSLWEDFEQELLKSTIHDKKLVCQLKNIRNALENYANSNKGEKIPLKSEESEGKEPGAFIFSEPEEKEVNVVKLERDVRMLRDPEYILRVASFLYKLQPEAVSLNQKVTISFKIIKPDVLKSLREYVTKMLRAAAVGEIDPLGKPAYDARVI